MKRVPQIGLLADGRRLHLQDGPIDLIVEAHGSEINLRAAYDAAARRFTGLLDELCGELPMLRQAADPARCLLQGTVARRMHYADGGSRRLRRRRGSRRDAGRGAA
jgi:ApbE superfamily uncharacterized protein (UPF0280 family)